MRRPDVRRHIDGTRAKFEDDLQQIPAVQPQDRPAVRMDISDLLQSGRNLLRILQPRQEEVPPVEIGTRPVCSNPRCITQTQPYLPPLVKQIGGVDCCAFCDAALK